MIYTHVAQTNRMGIVSPLDNEPKNKENRKIVVGEI
jgi:hypothetical protein